MNKIRLICVSSTDFSRRSHLTDVLSDLALEEYDPTTTYNKNECIFVVTYRSEWSDLLIFKYLDQGFKLIIATVGHSRPNFFLSKDFSPYLDNILVIVGCKNSFNYGWKNILDVPNWFWYNESLLYNLVQYQSYVPTRNNSKLFLMLLNRVNWFRDQIYIKFEKLLNNAVYSYIGKLNNPLELPVTNTSIPWIHQYNPSWYNNTYFSLVSETAVNSHYVLSNEMSGVVCYDVPCELIVSEKTFKPIAFQHPFIIVGMKGTLQHLRSVGFETYSHIFDENYDQLTSFTDRLNAIYTNIINFNIDAYHAPMTEQIIKHNFNRFYDNKIVREGIDKELIQPIKEWINV